MPPYFLLVSVCGGMGSVRPESTPKLSGNLVGVDPYSDRLHITKWVFDRITLEGFVSTCPASQLGSAAPCREGIINQHAISAGCHESQVAGHPPERLCKL